MQVDFQLINYIVNWISVAISATTVISIVWKYYAGFKRIFRIIWKIIIFWNREHPNRPLNIFETEDEPLYGKLIAQGMRLIFQADFGNKKLIYEMKKATDKLKLEIDDTKFYDKRYVQQVINYERKRMLQELKLKKLVKKRLKELKELRTEVASLDDEIRKIEYKIKKITSP